MKKQIDKDAIILGYVHPGYTHGEFAQRLSAASLDRRNNIRGVYAASNADHAVARNAIVKTLLAGSAEWLLWIDDDATFDTDAPARLLHQAVTKGATRAHAYSFGYDPHKNNVYGGAWEFMGDGWKGMPITGEDMWVDGVGCHFQLIHRSVYEDIGDADWHLNWGRHPDTGEHMGQDFALCLAAKEAGHDKVLYTPYVQTGHIKSWVVGYSDYLANHEDMEFDDEN